MFLVLNVQVMWQHDERHMRALMMNRQLTRRDRKVIDFTRSRVKNNPNLPIWGIKSELKGIMINKGRIHREIRYF